MAKQIDDGPNFGEPEPSVSPRTLRDEFAMAALQGLVSKGLEINEDKIGTKSFARVRSPISAAELACYCYEFADAMLLARQPEEVGRG